MPRPAEEADARRYAAVAPATPSARPDPTPYGATRTTSPEPPPSGYDSATTLSPAATTVAATTSATTDSHSQPPPPADRRGATRTVRPRRNRGALRGRVGGRRSQRAPDSTGGRSGIRRATDLLATSTMPTTSSPRTAGTNDTLAGSNTSSIERPCECVPPTRAKIECVRRVARTNV